MADLVLVAGDPTRDITTTAVITGIWRRGVRVPRHRHRPARPESPAADLSGLDPLAATARWTAVERARESARPDALFVDPLADALAGAPGRPLAERMRGDSQVDSPTSPYARGSSTTPSWPSR